MNNPAGVKPGTGVLVAMPAYNEEKYIGSLVLRARKYADAVIVVDDGSTDATAETAALAGAIVIRHEQRQGKGAAVQAIFKEARKRDADVLALLDADFQHNPDELPLVIKPIQDGYDLCIGARTAQAGKTPRLRRLGQKVLLLMARSISSPHITDSESGYRAFSRRAVTEMALTENGFAIESEMLAQAAEKDLRTVEVPITNIYTGDGSTLHPVRHGMGVLNRLIAMISMRRPLLFFGLFGGFFVLLGLALGIIVLRSVFADSSVLATGTALATILFITVGLQTVFTGIILNVLVSRLNHKP